MNAPWLAQNQPWIDDSDVAAVTAALRDGHAAPGRVVAEFEAALTAAVGATAIAVSSPTAALHATYAGLGLGPGDEVITTPMAAPAVATAAAITGARVKFADVCPDTANIDPAAVEKLLTPRTAVIAGADYAGHPMEIGDLRPLAERVGAVLVEDASHAIGGTYRDRPVGSVADITTFALSADGDIGAVSVSQPELLTEIQRFARQGKNLTSSELRHPDQGEWWYEMPAFGVDYRLSGMRAALGINQVKRIPSIAKRHATLVARYNQALAGLPGLGLPTQREGVSPAWGLYAVRIKYGRRREIFEKLRAGGIGVDVHHIPVYWHPIFADSGYRKGMCPVAEAFYAEQLSLPLSPTMTDADQQRVVETLAAALG